MYPSTTPTPEEMLLLEFREFRKHLQPVFGLTDEVRSRLQLESSTALARCEDPTGRELLRTTFNEFLRMFDRLSLIENNLEKLDTLLENLSILELLHFEIRLMVDFIEAEVMYNQNLTAKLRETFDGVVYGISHDLKRVFEREITSETRTRELPVVYGKIRYAHGVLTNCFQQAFITLLQALNPELDPIQVFNDFEERLRQSLLLCNELSLLIRAVKQAQEQLSIEILEDVVERVVEFCDGNMQYLMYRDWRTYEEHVLAVTTAIENDLDVTDVLHRFVCYLEVLYGHVKMRSVLKGVFQEQTEGDPES
jgi:DNA-binding FrmR family transcriptional regulator